ncbi:hypothetical protein M9Y10_004855 [Tritrichomonas musculus]|uniref:Uncharacterized protein n=1 Tax=Tritrichomonas musculus TaxID=1915356 RepID=A0ABR2JLJ2_9EUKA
MTGGEPVIEQKFENLNEAITYAFRHEQTSLLSLDRICEVLQNPNYYFNSKNQGLLPCSSITRRRISSVLSTSELFVRAGPPRTCLWAIRPHNPLFISDQAILASIEQMLTANGPMTIDQFINTTQLSGADANLYNRFLSEHGVEFTKDEDGTYWFTGQPRPQRNDFESISHALVYAFNEFPQGASVEELHWYLCLSTVGGIKEITRRCVSRELSRRTDLFSHLSRARYILLRSVQEAQSNQIRSNGNQIPPQQIPPQVPSPTQNLEIPQMPIVPQMARITMPQIHTNYLMKPQSLPSTNIIPIFAGNANNSIRPQNPRIGQPLQMPQIAPQVHGIPMHPIPQMNPINAMNTNDTMEHIPDIELQPPSPPMTNIPPFHFIEPMDPNDEIQHQSPLNEDEIFDPVNFFGNDFQFSFE